MSREAAGQFARLGGLARVGDVAAASRVLGRPPAEVVEAFSLIDESLGLPALEARLATLPSSGRWERWQARSLADDVAALRRESVERALARGGPPPEAIAAFVEARRDRLARLERLTRQVDDNNREALAVAALAVRALADLVHE
jgi:NAD-specific glutamate dehydrogenase